MTRKTESQSLGERGEATVSAVCVSAGWTADSTRSDFGEDIQFQTFFKGQRDPFRIYAQVKSFSRKPARITIKTRLLRNWLMMIDVIILFVYLEEDRSIHVFLPNMILDPISIYESNKEHTSLKFDSFFKIENVSDVEQFGWMIRYEYLTRAMIYADGRLNVCKYYGDYDEGDFANSYLYLRAKYATEPLRWVGLISEHSLFSLAGCYEVEWCREYLRKIDRGEVEPGHIGETFAKEMQFYLSKIFHDQQIHWHGYKLIFEMAARHFAGLLLDDAKSNNVGIAKIGEIDRPYKKQPKQRGRASARQRS